MTNAELIAKLQELPPDIEVGTMSFGYGSEGARWAIGIVTDVRRSVLDPNYAHFVSMKSHILENSNGHSFREL